MSKETLSVVIQLMTAAFGLVAALAWNTAIQSLFDAILGTGGGLAGQFVYAILVTIIVVFVTIRLGRMAERVGSEEESSS